MKYDFDRVLNRRNTGCMKWDYLQTFFGREDLNSMWVADMDFMALPEILSPIIDRAEHGIFGYTAKPKEFFNAVTDEGFWKNIQTQCCGISESALLLR